MKENFVSDIQHLLLGVEGGKNTVDINILGYINLVGFSPSKIKRGKEIYKRLETFLESKEQVQKSNISFNETNFDKIVFLINEHRWISKSLDDVILEKQFKGGKHSAVNVPKAMSRYNAVEYGIIEKTIVEDKGLDFDMQFSYLLNEFTDWLNDYSKSFSKTGLNTSKLLQLLKVIISK